MTWLDIVSFFLLVKWYFQCKRSVCEVEINQQQTIIRTAGDRIKTAKANMKAKHVFTMALIAVFGMSLFTSCIEQPTASFNVSNLSPSVGESVYFTNLSLDAESFEWDFGDGTSSTQMNPSHVYYTKGSKLVTMTAYSKRKKKSAMATTLVDVKATGDVMFWTDESTVYNITVNLESVGTKSITSYYSYVPSACGSSGCATFNDVPIGTYHFTAENLLYQWSGYVTVDESSCRKLLLYHSGSKPQLHPENQSTERLVQGSDEQDL